MGIQVDVRSGRCLRLQQLIDHTVGQVTGQDGWIGDPNTLFSAVGHGSFLEYDTNILH